MKLMTTFTNAAEAADRWKQQYLTNRYGGWLKSSLGDTGKIYKLLLNLGDSPHPDAVNATIQNDTWTKVWCDECKANVKVAIQLGEEPDYDSSTATICLKCLQDAVVMAKSHDHKRLV